MNSQPDQSSSDSRILMDYLPKLIRLVERNMSGRLQGKLGSDDMAQSVLGSILRVAGEGKIKIEESEDFWKQLVVISLNKVRKKSRYYNAKKRDYSREISFADDSLTLAELAQDYRDPTDEQGLEFAKLLERLDESLDADCRVVLEGKLAGLSHLEIAAMLPSKASSAKTVGRRLNDIKKTLALLSEEDD